MPLVLGLGNPGARYARTRHNVGWRVLEELAQRGQAVPLESGVNYRTLRAQLTGGETELMWPLTYMNASGDALREYRERHELASSDWLVVVDDVYLPVGTLRLKGRGSSGGHRGLESLEQAWDGREFARLRVGVGHVVAAELREHVLEEFEAEEESAVTEAITRAADAVEMWRRDGLTAAMNGFNRKPGQEAQAP